MSATPDSMLSVIRGELSRMKIPSAHDKVFKDECVYSFDSPYSNTGLYVNLRTFAGVGQDYLFLDAKRTSSKLYLFEKWDQIPVQVENVDLPTKLAIGVDGGFQTEKKYEVVKKHELVIVVDGSIAARFSLNNPQEEQAFPEYLINIIHACQKHDGMRQSLATAAWDASDAPKKISKYAADLPQLNPLNQRISQRPQDWKDEASDATDNLWLNLSTGYIGGGRKNWDGSGGSGSALQHYIDTGKKYPLVVKLGTITPHGADVYSYADDENDLVEDPHLSDHLAFWGIDIMKLEKTDKTMTEMNVALNNTYEWSKIMEGNQKLIPVYGPGLNGLKNIGSSCYMNSVLQALFTIPEFQERFLILRDTIIQGSSEPTEDLLVQLSKLAHALLTETYVPIEADRVTTSPELNDNGEIIPDGMLEKYVIAPRMLKGIVGKGNPDFSSNHQQDAFDYFVHFTNLLQRTEKVQLPKLLPSFTAANPRSTASIFEFTQEFKFKFLGTNDVKFGTPVVNNHLCLRLPLEKAVRSEDDVKESSESKRPRVEGGAQQESLLIPFSDCLEKTFEVEELDITHPARGVKARCVQSTRFSTFPRYLWVKLDRYVVAENWTVKKITAEVRMPEKFDLSAYGAIGILDGEIQVAEPLQNAGAAPRVADEELVSNLTSMGFSENGCRRAALATNNADVETAMNWILEHMEDADFNEPIVESLSSSATLPAVDEEQLMLLSSMGFTSEQATAALIACNNNMERAADWLFSRTDTLDADVAQVLNKDAKPAAASSSKDTALETGEGKYSLMAIVSHIGKNTEHGHYVTHIRKNGEWFLFNDEKVGKSEKPPIGFGYMYLYRRDDGNGSLF